MTLTRKTKKRMAIYTVGTVASILRTGISAANLITKTGVKMGEIMAQLVIGSAMSMADEICGVRSSTHIGDGLMRGCSAILATTTDFTEKHLNRGITSLESFAKERIKRIR